MAVFIERLATRCWEGIHIEAYVVRYGFKMRQCIRCGNYLTGDF
jgi:hypothetical protein